MLQYIALYIFRRTILGEIPISALLCKETKTADLYQLSPRREPSSSDLARAGSRMDICIAGILAALRPTSDAATAENNTIDPPMSVVRGGTSANASQTQSGPSTVCSRASSEERSAVK